MLNTIAKFLLVSTSLSPLLGAVAINQFTRGAPATSYGAWLVAAVLLVVLCWFLLQYASKNCQKHCYQMKEFEREDKEVLTFLVTYLLPFISKDKMGFAGDWLTGSYILLIIFLVVAHSGTFQFNPVMGLLGFHFYYVKNIDGCSHLLISRPELRRPVEELQTVRLAHNIYLNTGTAHA